jgi:AraC-like DNA-binding protein
MDHTTTDQARKPSKSRFFNVRKWIKELAITRAMRTMLTALLFAVDGETLASDKYPVTIDRITQESGYSRAQTFEILNDLEKAGLVERIRHRRQLTSGEWINDPTTYCIIVDDAERERLAAIKAAEPPRERHPKKEHAPRVKVVSSESTEPINASEPAPQPLPPIPVPERAKANVAPAYADEMRRPPQSPNDDHEVTELGDELMAHADEALASVAYVAKPRTIEAARAGIYARRYSLATQALDIRDQFCVDESELIEAVYEWTRKVVARNLSRSPSRLAGILGTFIRGKGDSIVQLRKSLNTA